MKGPASKTIPHSRPTLGMGEINAVSHVISSGHVSQGEEVQRFERAFAKKFGLDDAAGTSSGTAALHLTLLAFDIGTGDEVIIPSYVCTALLSAVNYTGASPVIADIDPVTYNLDPADVKKRLTSSTRAIIVPHMFGMPAEIDRFLEMNIPVIEDCAQSLGSTYNNLPVGTYGDAAIFSFYATKVITTGEGGMVVSRSKKIIERIKDMREYDNKNQYKVRFNYKMTDVAAAMGLIQLSRLKGFIDCRRLLAQKYFRRLQSAGVVLPPDHADHIYYRYVINKSDNAAGWIKQLARRGVTCARPIFQPLHRLLGLDGYPHTDLVWAGALSLPIYPSLSDEEFGRVIHAVYDIQKEQAGNEKP